MNHYGNYNPLEGHPERNSCRYCESLKSCLWAHARNYLPCATFSISRSDTERFLRFDAEAERKAQAKADAEKFNIEPCPYCGGPSHISEDPEDWGYHPAHYCVSCDDMDCRGHKNADGLDPESKEEAVRKWNRRAAK